jgi:hypothetical protein
MPSESRGVHERRPCIAGYMQQGSSWATGHTIMSFPTVFETCQPRPEVLAGDLPDAIFAADLWEVIQEQAHPDYKDPRLFFRNSHPTESLKLLLADAGSRLDGEGGGTPVFRLETGFGGGKTHNLIGLVHLAREGRNLADTLSPFDVHRLPPAGVTKIAAFIGDQADPQSGLRHRDTQGQLRTYTPWGEIAYQIGGRAGYKIVKDVKDNDEHGGSPSRTALADAFGGHPVLILIDELPLYLAKAVALPDGHPRKHVMSQMPTFLQTLFTLAANRPRTVVVFTLPSEQDANRRITAELKQHLPAVIEADSEMEQVSNRQARNLTPTQTYERAAVLARRLFVSVDRSAVAAIVRAYEEYYADQTQAGVDLDNRALTSDYINQLSTYYPFHPELIRLFAERLADIPEFHATRGALRLMARTIRAVWSNRGSSQPPLLFHPHHIDLARAEIRDELLSRLGKTALGPALEADVVKVEGGTHAELVERGWPAKAATESALTIFLHSLPEGARGLTIPEVALAIGRPGYDLAYIHRAVEETEARAWYMRREGDRYLFRTRASVNKRFQERAAQVHPPEIKSTLDDWVEEIYSGFEAFQVLLFPEDHTAIPDRGERIRLAIIHYDKECGYVGGGERLNFAKTLFTVAESSRSPRVYRNNLVFLLAEASRIDTLKDTVRALIAWERVYDDLEQEQRHLAERHSADYRTLKEAVRQGESGVPAEFMALESDLNTVVGKLSVQGLAVRTRLIEAYRVVAFPQKVTEDGDGLFGDSQSGSLLECFRVDFGELPRPASGRGQRGPRIRDAVPEGPILQCLREHNKLVPEATPDNALILAPSVVKQPPLWRREERCLSTAEVWERVRRDPDLPMVLKQTDLLPTLRAGLSTSPDPLWAYYDQLEKRVYTQETARALAPILATHHFLYDPRAAAADRIIPVASMAGADIWNHLWPREGTEHVPMVNTQMLYEALKTSVHFPVIPERTILWRALQDGTRENRWILYLRGANLAIGSQELHEWPSTPRFDDQSELWLYQAALDTGIYPRQTGVQESEEEQLTPRGLRDRCWPLRLDRVLTEDIERSARNISRGLNRSRLESLLLEGHRQGLWGAWQQDGDEMFYLVR